MNKNYIILLACLWTLSLTLHAQFLQLGQGTDGETKGDLSRRSVNISADDNPVTRETSYSNNTNDNTATRETSYSNNTNDNPATRETSHSNNADDNPATRETPYSNNANGSSASHVYMYRYAANTRTQQEQAIDGKEAYDKSGRSINPSAESHPITIGNQPLHGYVHFLAIFSNRHHDDVSRPPPSIQPEPPIAYKTMNMSRFSSCA